VRKCLMSVPCPCCRFYTLPERGVFARCPVCYWEDDGQDDADANMARANLVSLSEARDNFDTLGEANCSTSER
jgi:hypothetical protein